MKTEIFIFLIFFVVFVYCDNSGESNKKLPKVYRGVKIFNPRKFSKIKYFLNIVRKIDNVPKIIENKSYTAFAPISVVRQNVPNSPYFNPEQNVDLNPRVKKVLPQYAGHYMVKRSIEFNATADARRKKHNIEDVESASNKTFDKNKNVNAEAKSTSKIKRGKRLRAHKKSHKHNIRHHRNAFETKENKNRQKIQNPDRSVKERASKLRKQKSKRSRKQKANKTRIIHDDKTIRNGKVRNRRLIAGKDAMIEDYPYVVSIQKSGEHWCAGALLNPRLVITTANCIWKSNRMSRMKVRAGSRYVDRGGQVARIQEVMKHPYWSIRKNPDYDVGLLLLDRNIKFSDSTHAVDLPNVAMYPAFEDAWVTSWGAERRDGVFENKGMALQVYHARLIDFNKCNNVTQRFGVVVSNNFICLAQTGRRAPCTRDTGAPAVSDGILWGMASWGLRKLCGTERYPAMFSYVGSRSNLDFITNATHYLMADQRFYAYPDKFVLNKADTTQSPTTSNLEY
ncbi:unnamed protein product [Leptosia nina]|uniref:Peptidase S1 domain-containing protein n=1 Tax=Leptosia nina TaxID=320188 RepID=A0AAV1J298_9NEOP